MTLEPTARRFLPWSGCLTHFVRLSMSTHSAMHPSTLSHEIGMMWISAWSKAKLTSATTRQIAASTEMKRPWDLGASCGIWGGPVSGIGSGPSMRPLSHMAKPPPPADAKALWENSSGPATRNRATFVGALHQCLRLGVSLATRKIALCGLRLRSGGPIVIKSPAYPSCSSSFFHPDRKPPNQAILKPVWPTLKRRPQDARLQCRRSGKVRSCRR